MQFVRDYEDPDGDGMRTMWRAVAPPYQYRLFGKWHREKPGGRLKWCYRVERSTGSGWRPVDGGWFTKFYDARAVIAADAAEQRHR